MSDAKKLADSKEAVRRWAVLLLRALPECEDVEESVMVANLAMESLPASVALAIEDKEEKKIHKFASTQFNLEDAAWSRDEDPLPKIRHMARQINDEDLADDGREEHPHVTVKYGLHTDDADEVAQVVRDFGPVQVTLGKTFLFPGEEYDVVNVEVKSPALVRLNKLISDSLECTDTHPEYVPHVCLAYVKSGLGKKYEGIDRVDGMRLTFQDLIFSDKRREKVDCRLSLEEFSAHFAHDIDNRRAQGILNRTIEASKKMTAAARRDLEKALMTDDQGELRRAIYSFVQKYRAQLVDLLTTTQLASLLEGAKEVARDIPTVPMFPGAVRPPATLEPAKAVEMLNELKQMTVMERESKIYELPADQQTFVRQGILATEQGPEVPPTYFVPNVPVDGTSPEKIHYPIIDEAAKQLSEKNVMTRAQFDRLDAAARQKAFTVASVESEATLEKIRDVMAKTIEQGADVQTFREQMLEAVDEGTFLSDWHMETVYRTNVQTAFSDGQMAVLQHPFVQSGFPYASYEAIDDDRVEHDHLALMKLGIQGTNIYRIDDPVFQLFRPPWRWSCRCSWIPMTVRQAAREGIEEAKQWQKTGIEPVDKAFVPMPSFRPPPGFVRSISGAPLSIRLSLEPMDLGAVFAFDESKVKRDKDGQFAKQAEKIPHGELHHVGGIPVRRTGERSFRVETDKGHVEGDAERIGEHVAEDHAKRGLHGKARDKALERGGPSAKDIQAKSHKFADIASGKHPAGVEGRGGKDIEEAKRLGLYVNTVKGVTFFAKDKESAAPLESYLEKGGKYGTPEFSKALGYTGDEIEEYKRFLAGNDHQELLKRAAKSREYGPDYSRDIAASASRLDDMLSQGRTKEADHWAEELELRLDAAGVAALPKGAKVVSLDPNTHGRVGEIVKVDGVNRVKLEGTPGFASDHVEPLDEKLSWRVVEKVEKKEEKSRLLFDESEHIPKKEAKRILKEVLTAKQRPVTDKEVEDFFAVRPEQGRLFSVEDDGKGRCLTIGGSKGADGKRHGGSPVYIVNGKITKGHPSLTGKKLGSLEGETEHGTHKQQLHQSKQYEKSVWAKKARKEGVDKESLHQVAKEIKQHHDAHAEDVKSLLQDARSSKVAIHHKQLSETGDHTKIAGFDILARELAGRYPHILGAHGYGHVEGNDIDSEEASEKLMELLRAGNPDKMSDDDAYREAFDYLMEEKNKELPKEDGLEDVPFSMNGGKIQSGGSAKDRRKARRAAARAERERQSAELSIASDKRVEKLIAAVENRPINVNVTMPEQQPIVIPAPVVNVNVEQPAPAVKKTIEIKSPDGRTWTGESS